MAPPPRPAARLVVFGFDGCAVNEHAKRMVSRGCGGVVLFARNVRDPVQVAALSKELKTLAMERQRGNKRLLVLIDQEGGRVARVGPPATVLPSARDVGASPAPASTASAVGQVVGCELRAMGVDVNFAPVVDVDTNPNNPVIGARSFGRDAAAVGGAASSFIRAQQGSGVAAVAKHWPGHGDTSLDTHVGACVVPHSIERLRRVEIPPFVDAVASGVAGVLVAHVGCPALASHRSYAGVVDDGALPATMSRGAVDALRDLPFRGVIFTDDMEMGAVVKQYGAGPAAAAAAAAGCEAILMCHTESRQEEAIEALERAAASGEVNLTEAHAHLDALMDRYCAPPPLEEPQGGHVLTVVGSDANRRLVEGLLRGAGAQPAGNGKAEA